MLSITRAFRAAEHLQSMGFEDITIGTDRAAPFLRGVRVAQDGAVERVTFRPLTPSLRKGWDVVGWVWEEWHETLPDSMELVDSIVDADCDGLDACVASFDVSIRHGEGWDSRGSI